MHEILILNEGKGSERNGEIFEYGTTVRARWPTDPVEMAKLTEMMFTSIDDALKTGDLSEFGFFLDGRSGYSIASGESKDTFRRVSGFTPWVMSEVYEMVPYEIGKEILRRIYKAQAEAMAAMKR